MKKLFFCLLLAMAVNIDSKAQVNVNINLGSQPSWGPAGYNYVDYYYLPDIESYYYVPKRQFIYLNNGQWVFANALPSRYQGYNLFSGYKVVINRPTPYLQFQEDRVKYVGYKNKKGAQVTIKQKNAGNKVAANTAKGGANSKIKTGGSGNFKARGNGNANKGGHGGSHGNGGGKGNGNGGGKGKN